MNPFVWALRKFTLFRPKAVPPPPSDYPFGVLRTERKDDTEIHEVRCTGAPDNDADSLAVANTAWKAFLKDPSLKMIVTKVVDDPE